jgi:hypothetical protein
MIEKHPVFCKLEPNTKLLRQDMRDGINAPLLELHLTFDNVLHELLEIW